MMPSTFAVQWQRFPNGAPEKERGYLIAIDEYDSPAGRVRLYQPSLRDGLFYRSIDTENGEVWDVGVVSRVGPRAVPPFVPQEAP